MLRCGSCSVCDLVRLAVRPVNSDFDIFIRILFYLNNKWREDARKLSRPRHGLVNTKTTTGSSEPWSIFFFFFFGPSEPKRQWLGLLCGFCLKSICVRFNKQRHRCKADVISWRRMACWRQSNAKWLRDGRSKLADTSPLTTQRAWATNRWLFRHSDHEEVTNHSAHWTPLIRIHTYNGIEKFWNGYNSRKRRLLRVLSFCTWSTRWRQVTVQKACAYDVRKAPSTISYFPLIKLGVLNGKPHIKKGVKRIAVVWSHLLTTPWCHTHKFLISLRDWFYDHIQSGSKSKCNRVSQPPRRLWHSITLGLWPRCLRTSKFLPPVDLPRNCMHNVFSFRGSLQNACRCNTMKTNTET